MNQRSIILARLKSKPTVKGYEFAMIDGILQYNARIKELRELGHNIPQPVIEVVNGQRQSTYTLIEGGE